jgi:hypothetical protein
MKPAVFTTDEPPVPIDDMLVKEYINELRRRIEVLNIQMETLVQQLHEAKNRPEISDASQN